MKLSRLAASAVVGLIALEIGLRAAGCLFLLSSDKDNEPRPDDRGKLRILILGESTSADFFSSIKFGAWPRLLEAKLNQAGIPTRVYNEATVGTSTAMIASNLPGYIEKDHPQIAISMMGINDPPDLRYDSSARSRFQLLVSRLRVVKLGAWIATWVDASFICHRLDTTVLTPEEEPLAEKALSADQKESVPEFEARIRRDFPEFKDDRKVALVLTRASRALRGDFGSRADPERSFAFIERAFELDPYHHDVAFWELNTLVSRRNPVPCAKAIAILLKAGPNLPDDLLTQMALCKSGGVLAGSSLLRSKRILVAAGGAPPTPYHYHLIHRLLRDRGISHVAMQYPTLPLAELKGYFQRPDGSTEEPFRDIVFVSNSDSFAEALRTHPYEKIFKDRFRGSWGHTTALGYELIAEAVYPKVLDVIQSHPEWGFSVKGATKSAEESQN